MEGEGWDGLGSVFPGPVEVLLGSREGSRASLLSAGAVEARAASSGGAVLSRSSSSLT